MRLEFYAVFVALTTFSIKAHVYIILHTPGHSFSFPVYIKKKKEENLYLENNSRID